MLIVNRYPDREANADCAAFGHADGRSVHGGSQRARSCFHHLLDVARPSRGGQLLRKKGALQRACPLTRPRTMLEGSVGAE
jgi:hypothetical protein